MKTPGKYRAATPVSAGPHVHVRNLQRKVRLNLASLRRFAGRAAAVVWELTPRRGSAAEYPDDIFVMLISDERITDLHQRFMKEPGPTDVITFQHGEIFISVPTAQRQARQFGTSTMDEIQLYIAHGLLHLRGFDDHNASERAEMRAAEAKVLRSVTV